MKIAVKLVILLFSYILCFYFGWTVKNAENIELKKSIISSVENWTTEQKQYTKQNIDLLFALKENKLDVIENVLKSNIKGAINYPMYSKPNENDKTALKIYEQARSFQELYCDNNCLIEVE